LAQGREPSFCIHAPLFGTAINLRLVHKHDVAVSVVRWHVVFVAV